MYKDMNKLFTALGRSKFRSQFKLSPREKNYLQKKTPETIAQHARKFINERIAPAHPHNDGKQTPMKNHPVFIAQHATGTCCRKCLQKWHHIPQGRNLTEEETDYIVKIIMLWLKKHTTLL